MAMSDNGGATVRERITAVQIAVERRIPASKDRAERSAAAFRRRLDSTRALARQNHDSLDKLDQLKQELTGLQAQLSNAQSVKARNDSKMNIVKEEIEKRSEQHEKIKTLLSDKRTKLEEYSSIVSNNLSKVENLERTVVQDEEDLNIAIKWYQNVLGFRVIGGNGLTFIFDKIKLSNPKKEFSFTVKLEKNKFILCKCDPYIEAMDGLLDEFDAIKDLFLFARVMRDKFTTCVLAVEDSITATESDQQGSSSTYSTIVPSYPVLPPVELLSPVRSSPVNPPVESTPVINRSGKGKKGRSTPSSSVRRSARLRVRES